MGTVPNRHPVYISEIRDALGGANDLAWYRGRQYWNAAGNVVHIGGNAAMSEFPGLTNQAPWASSIQGGSWGGGSNGNHGYVSPARGGIGSIANNLGFIDAMWAGGSGPWFFFTIIGLRPASWSGIRFSNGLSLGAAQLVFAGHQIAYDGVMNIDQLFGFAGFLQFTFDGLSVS